MQSNDSCPKCQAPLAYEDQSSVGGPKDYWFCTQCDEEQMMFITGFKRD
jgi:hypothetical protein